jgi:peptide/nickel transport system substrate-binding protein
MSSSVAASRPKRLLKDVKSQASDAICEVTATGGSRNLIVNRDAPPFDNADMRRAMALSLDRKAFIDIISEDQGDIGGVMQPLREGVWGMPPDVLQTLPGYDPDVQKNRTEARQIMPNLGYGPDKRLALKISTRNIPPYRDPAVILADQLREAFIDGELEIVETASWFPKVMRKNYKIGLNLTAGGVDDPDQQFYENYVCGSPRNYSGYCNPELEKLFDRQSTEADEGKRKKLVREIETKLAEDGARPIIFYHRIAYCWQPRVKGWTMMVNSIINNWRMEDVWLDQ